MSQQKLQDKNTSTLNRITPPSQQQKVTHQHQLLKQVTKLKFISLLFFLHFFFPFIMNIVDIYHKHKSQKIFTEYTHRKHAYI